MLLSIERLGPKQSWEWDTQNPRRIWYRWNNRKEWASFVVRFISHSVNECAVMAATARKPILYFIVFTVFITFYDLSNTTEHLRFYNCFMKTAGFYSDCFIEAELQRLFVVYRLKLIWTKKASSHCTRLAVTKGSKHDQTSLVISESGHLLDLTICVDIHPNPGWDRDELIPRATSTR